MKNNFQIHQSIPYRSISHGSIPRYRNCFYSLFLFPFFFHLAVRLNTCILRALADSRPIRIFPARSPVHPLNFHLQKKKKKKLQREISNSQPILSRARSLDISTGLPLEASSPRFTKISTETSPPMVYLSRRNSPSSPTNTPCLMVIGSRGKMW